MILSGNFYKVKKRATLNDLMQLIKNQEINLCKVISYNLISTILISASEFEILSKDISKPQAYYLPYIDLSLPNEYGLWNCVAVHCEENNQQITIYLAGRCFPLYASIY